MRSTSTSRSTSSRTSRGRSSGRSPASGRRSEHGGGLRHRVAAGRVERTRMDSGTEDGLIAGATHVIEPHGEIDLASAAKVKAAVDAAADAGARYVIVDLEN